MKGLTYFVYQAGKTSWSGSWLPSGPGRRYLWPQCHSCTPRDCWVLIRCHCPVPRAVYSAAGTWWRWRANRRRMSWRWRWGTCGPTSGWRSACPGWAGQEYSTWKTEQNSETRDYGTTSKVRSKWERTQTQVTNRSAQHKGCASSRNGRHKHERKHERFGSSENAQRRHKHKYKRYASSKNGWHKQKRKHERCAPSGNGRHKHKHKQKRSAPSENWRRVQAREMCVKWKRATQTQTQAKEKCAKWKLATSASTIDVRQVETGDTNTKHKQKRDGGQIERSSANTKRAFS